MLEFILSGSSMVFGLVFIITWLLVYWAQHRLKYRLPPGPAGLPLIGNMLQMDSKLLHKQAYDWSKQYGPVISLKMGPMLIVFVNDIETALEVLVEKSTDFASRKLTYSLNLFTDNGRDIMFSGYSPTWHLQKTIASKALRKYTKGEQLERIVWTAAEPFLDVLEEQEPIELNSHLNKLAAKMLLTLCFGEKPKDKNDDSEGAINALDEFFYFSSGFVLEDIFPHLRYIYKTNMLRKAERCVKVYLREFIEKRFEDEETTFDKGKTRHLVDALLLAKHNMEEEEGIEDLKLTKSHLVQTCSDMVFGGMDSIRVTLGFAILYMMKFPDIQKKVQEEIDRVVGKDRLPGLADRPMLCYTEAVLYESMRYSSFIPVGLFHMTTCDTSAGGYDIPKGTLVGINFWALNNDPNAWRDVDKFIPERFLDGNGKLGPFPRNFMPFSAGKRVCPGQVLSKPELHLLFATFMQRFIWKPEQGVIPDVSPNGNYITLFPKPYKAVVKSRF